jgi:GDP-L-fucose synthase
VKATVFGSSGLLGHALQKTANPHFNLYCPRSKEVDLRQKSELSKIDNNDLWINAAAKVGGVVANTREIGDFFKDNIDIGVNVLNVAKDLGVKKVVSILSTCIYPDADHVTYPLTEDQLHLGPPHASNFGYAYAKRMLDVASKAYRQQWGCNFVTVVPNNLYGPHDNYDLNSSHVIPALIRKFFEAQRRKTDVVVWGTGRPLREFTFSEDAARIIWWVSENYNEVDPINVGNTEEISIGDLAQLISKIISFQGKIKFDTSKPDGQFRKPTSNKKLLALGYKPIFTGLEEGLTKTIEHFMSKYPNVRGVGHNPDFII